MSSNLASAAYNRRQGRASRHELARALCEANFESLDGAREYELPSREVLSAILWELRSALFALHFGARRRSRHEAVEHVRRVLDGALSALEDQIRLGLLHDAARRRASALDCDARAFELTESFAARLPRVRAMLGGDIRAALESAPVVIGETSVIGPRVRLYQGVTLGSGGVSGDPALRPLGLGPRHPIVEADVVIQAGAVLLGRIVVGRGSVIGANVCLTESVPPSSRVEGPQIVLTRLGGTGS